MMTQQPEPVTEPVSEDDADQSVPPAKEAAQQAEPAAPQAEQAAPEIEQVAPPTQQVAPQAQEASPPVEQPAPAVAPQATERPPIRAQRPAPREIPDAQPAAVAPVETTSGEAEPEAQPVAPSAPPTTPMAQVAAQAHGPRKATKNEQPMSEFQMRTAPVSVAPKPRHLQPERSSYAAPAATSQPSRSADYSQGEAKYATYSKSEVDYMLKQQAESILTALSGKISAQQRSFQDAVVAQEKSFAKLSDNFIAQFEAARVKLENTAKQSQQSTRTDLEEFNKTLSKELDQYRSQISKIVAKSAEGGKASAQQKEAAAKPQNVPPKAQQALTAGQAKLQNLVMVTVVLSASSLILSLWMLVQHAR